MVEGCCKLAHFPEPGAAGGPTIIITHGEVPEQLERQIESLDADLLVMGTHGRTGISKLLLGSTAEAMLGRAYCDVLMTRS